MSKRIRAELVLILVTILWGVSFPIIEMSVKSIASNQLVFWRFLVSAVFLLPFVMHLLNKTNRTLLFFSGILGTINFISYFTQTMGLETISSGRSAFITGSSVLLVPFLAPLFKLNKPQMLDYVSVIIGLTGLYILTGTSLKFGQGDFLTFICAISCAFEIIIAQIASERKFNNKLLTFYQITFTIPFCLLIPSPIITSNLFIAQNMIFIFILAVCNTVLVLYLRFKYQKDTTAHRAALIFILEPVFAVLAAYLILGSKITPEMILGGLIILVAILIPDLCGYLSFKRLSKS
ncbi:hypothetical protein CF386_11135 [Paraphotobacterium marinum]|uniref:EamA domain-containing protein n=1 Tax=Paraphotobacterium marinum TaxID=1755811 RepID=A0A220VH63_9GAMM|nr:DMT family transporter [Paraphotobacterium marinum]ASK79600.1 hypothetical protein CF386_11135 [Paraphotobacterium marinum]